jgi:hypothetical protein
MRVRVVRAGGFAGIEEEMASVDTEASPSGAEIEQRIEEIGFFDLPANLEEDTGADQMRYEVTVSDGDRERTVTYSADPTLDLGAAGGPRAELDAIVQRLIQPD